ncbi:hypothetical protein TYRP_012489 [Tyrophagus putrescentiae]|nr:hypothetical protein TYRP_012489 [Tyrophagus putrescentiae]
MIDKALLSRTVEGARVFSGGKLIFAFLVFGGRLLAAETLRRRGTSAAGSCLAGARRRPLLLLFLLLLLFAADDCLHEVSELLLVDSAVRLLRVDGGQQALQIALREAHAHVIEDLTQVGGGDEAVAVPIKGAEGGVELVDCRDGVDHLVERLDETLEGDAGVLVNAHLRAQLKDLVVGDGDAQGAQDFTDLFLRDYQALLIIAEGDKHLANEFALIIFKTQ